MTTGLVWDERFFWFDTGRGLPPIHGSQLYPAFDHPDTKRRIKGLLDVSGIMEQLTIIKPVPFERADLLRFHTPECVDRVESLSNENGGDTGENAWIGPGDFPTALLAVGGCHAALEAVLSGAVDNAYALVRPCGHHSTRERGRGFAIFCNIALAIMKARATTSLGRVAVVDWDVHHGNGTQDAFYADASTLTISIHQDNCYPKGTGTVEERGEGEGFGFNLNVPLPPGSGHGAYLETFDRVVLPALERFNPECVIVASGLDANGLDPLARMMCYSDTYREMTKRLMAFTDAHCDGKLLVCHEGGYSAVYVPFAALAIMETLTGQRTDVFDPLESFIAEYGGQDLQPHQSEVIEQVAEFVRSI